MKPNPTQLPLILIAVTLLSVFNARADYQSTVLADNPIAYYPLDLEVDTSGYATDVSGNGNDGTYVNIYPGYNDVPGPSAYITNGVAFDYYEYVDLSTGTNTGILNFGGQITMEAWVQPASSSEYNADILAKGYDSSQNYDELELRADGGVYHTGTYGPNGDKGVSGGAQTTDWTYVVSTFDGANWNIYVNGDLKASSADTVGAINFSTPWAIGNGTADAANVRYFTGNISEVALYTNALTATQIKAHYLVGEYGTTNVAPLVLGHTGAHTNYIGATLSVMVSSIAPPDYQWSSNSVPIAGATNSTLVLNYAGSANYSVLVSNAGGSTNVTIGTVETDPAPNPYAAAIMADQPLAFYPLNETSGTTAADHAGSYDGVYQNSPTLNVAGPSSTIASGVTFNGSSQYVSMGNPVGLDIQGPVTLEAWARPSTTPADGTGYGNILAHGYSSSDFDETVLRVESYSASSGWYEVETYNGTTWTSVNTAYTIPGGDFAGSWVHLVGTYDGSNWNLYRNGVLVAQTTTDSHGAWSAVGNWGIGANATQLNRFFNGSVSEAAIYNYALTPDQIYTHYTMGVYGTNTAPIVTGHTASHTNYAGASPRLSVTAVGSLPLSYQWMSNSVPIAGATNPAVTISPVQATATYSVLVSNMAGSVTTNIATISVVSAPAYSAVVLADHPLAYYPLDETNGTVAHDVAGTYDGTYVNGPALGVAGPSPAAAFGAGFNGTDQLVNMGNPVGLNLGGPITLEAWAQLPASPSWVAGQDIGYIVTHGYSSFDYDETALYASGDTNAIGVPNYGTETYNGTYWNTVGNWSLIPGGDFGGSWVHLVGTYDGSDWILYRNGVAVATNSVDSIGAWPGVGVWGIGGNPNVPNRFFEGNICQVAIYGYALTPASIQAHYAAAVSVPVLNIAPSGGNVTITWTGGGTLQSSTNVAGPYLDVTGAVSGYMAPMTNTTMFFRVKQ